MAKDPRVVERDRVAAERWVERMQGDFAPGYTPERTPDDSRRLAIAAEYAAFQLGQINKRMGRLIELLEAQQQKK